MFKRSMNKTFMFAMALLVCHTAEARPEYVPTVQTALGTTSVSCSACHAGAAGEGNAVLPLAATWRTGADLALSDSDGDGFNNKQEVNGALTNFNTVSISPFTIAKAAESSTSTKVVVTGAGIVTETAVTDIYAQAGIAVAAGSEITSAVSPTVNTFPATITFSRPVTSTSKVYTVDFAAKTNTLITTGITYNANGSLTISGLTGPVNIVVDRVIPIAPAPGSGGYNVGGDKEGPCMTSYATPTLMMMLSLLTIGLFIRRKKA